MPRRHLANDKLAMHGSTAVPSCMFALHAAAAPKEKVSAVPSCCC